MSHLKAALVGLTVALLALVGLTSASSASAAPTQALPHCASAVVANTAPAKAVTKTQCFATYAEAIAAATGDTRFVGKSVAAVDAALANPTLLGAQATAGSAAIAAASTLLGTDWKDGGFNGASWSYYGTSGNCKSGSYYSFPMGSGFNDEVSSARSWPSSNCNHFVHYENGGLGGASIDCPYCTTLGSAMNDRTSSVKLTS